MFPFLERDRAGTVTCTNIFGNRTAKIKQMGDIRPLAVDDADSIIHSYNLALHQETVTA